MKVRGIFLFFLLVNLSFFPAFQSGSLHAQKVALVLSGGGARGVAHIGVIRALEENHIPIDYIAGTSIGAIVACLYSIGYTPDEMETLIKSKEFNRWASGVMDDKYIYFYRKDDPNSSWVSLDINFKKKLTSQLPYNLISPYEMDFAFMELFAPASAVSGYNFNDLVVPFRCVVSDVDSTTTMVMRNGDLATAVRGSMTIPFIFKPITINKKLVFDGGMYDNFPVDVANREFHPDVIIGSRVAQRYENPDKDDALALLLRMLMERQSDTLLSPNSLMVVPNIPRINIIDFSRTPEVIDSGYTAMKRKISDIRKMVRSDVDSLQLARKREEFRKKCPPLIFDSIIVTGLTKSQTDYVIRILKHGKKLITLDELKTAYFRFINEGYVKNIFPVARYNSFTGHYDLLLDIQRSENFNIQFGGNVSLGTNTQGFAEISYKHLWTKAVQFMVNGYFGRFYTSAKASARVDFNSKEPFFLEGCYTYNNYNYFRNSIYFFDDKQPNYIIQSEYFGNIRLGLPVTTKGKLMFDGTYAFTKDKYYQTNSFSRYDTADQTNFDFVSPTFSFELNNLNRKQYADAGARLKLSCSYINGMESSTPGSTSVNKDLTSNHLEWFQLNFCYDNYFQSLGPFKFGFYGEGLISNRPLFSNYTASIINAGIFEPLPEMQSFFLPAYRANNYIAGGLKAILKVYKKIDFRLEGYIFVPFREIISDPETKTAYYGPPFSSISYLGSAMFVYNTFLGPISLGVNYYDKTPESFTVNLNIGYLIFNSRAMH